MKRLADHRSIIAIDPNSRGLAFTWFEGGVLLDWGTRRAAGDEVVLLGQLIDRYKVDVVVLEDAEAQRSERRPRIRRLLRLLADHARERGVAVLAVRRYEVRREWRERGLTNKHSVSKAIAAMFPEIEPLVPREKKPYRSFETRGDIFDALSLVLLAMRCASDRRPNEEECCGEVVRSSDD
jgi:hypothetical protein